MSLLPYDIFPRSMFSSNIDDWFQQPLMSPYSRLPSQLSRLDIFDPFDELDNLISNNLRWLNRPEFLTRNLPLTPRVPRKYRISCDCAGFTHETIKTEIQKNKLIVSGRQEEKKHEETGDYAKREFRRTYDIPNNAEVEKMASFMAGDTLVIEFPLKEEEVTLAGVSPVELLPKILDNPDGTQSVQMNFQVPESVDPSKVHVSVKDRDLIVRVEDRKQRADGSSRFHYYQRTTLPENTRVDQIRCVQDKNSITATAPLGDHPIHSYRSIPIETKEKQQQLPQQQHQKELPQQQKQLQQQQQQQQQQQKQKSK